MGDICFYLSAAMLGAGLGTDDAFGHMFVGAAALLVVCAPVFNYLLGEDT